MPLEKLIIASNGLDYFEEVKANKEVVPTFRITAATELFIKSLDEVSKVLLSCAAIDKPLSTEVLLNRLELKNWQEIRPFEYYLSQLKQKLDTFRKTLQNMFKIGKSN